MFNFSELKTKTAVLLQRSGDTAYLTEIGIWLNLAQEHLFNIYDYWEPLKDVYNFSTVASTGDYYMPARFDKPLRIYDLTNNKPVHIKTEEEYFDANVANISNATEGTPEFARIYGESGVTANVSTSGDTVKVKSSSSSDVSTASAPLIVRVEGYIDAAMTVIAYENISLNGTTYVAGTTTFYKVLHVSKSADTTGFITLASSGGTVLLLMSPADRVSRHKVMKFGLIPDSAISMRILFKRRLVKMVNDYDYPFMEADNYLMLEACGYGLSQEKEGFDKATTMWSKAKDELGVLLVNHQNKYGPSFQHKIMPSNYLAHRS